MKETFFALPAFVSSWGELIFRFFLTFLLCGLLGFEREKKGRPAGLRTFLLVGGGSALFTITGLYLNATLGDADAARIPAQIVTGVGFLGAGTIITTNRQKVLGLTTAAGLWASAALGIAVGSGLYLPSIIGGLLFYFSLSGLDGVESASRNTAKKMYVEIEHTKDFQMQTLVDFTKKYNATLHHVEHASIETPSEILGIIQVSIHFEERVDHDQMLRELRSLNGIVVVHTNY